MRPFQRSRGDTEYGYLTCRICASAISIACDDVSSSFHERDASRIVPSGECAQHEMRCREARLPLLGLQDHLFDEHLCGDCQSGGSPALQRPRDSQPQPARLEGRASKRPGGAYLGTCDAYQDETQPDLRFTQSFGAGERVI